MCINVYVYAHKSTSVLFVGYLPLTYIHTYIHTHTHRSPSLPCPTVRSPLRLRAHLPRGSSRYVCVCVCVYGCCIQRGSHKLESLFPFCLLTYITHTHTPTHTQRCAGIEKGAQKTVHESVGSVHVKHIYEIAKIKHKDYHLSHLPLRSICRMIYGTCGTMGLSVDGLKDPPPV